MIQHAMSRKTAPSFRKILNPANRQVSHEPSLLDRPAPLRRGRRRQVDPPLHRMSAVLRSASPLRGEGIPAYPCRLARRRPLGRNPPAFPAEGLSPLNVSCVRTGYRNQKPGLSVSHHESLTQPRPLFVSAVRNRLHGKTQKESSQPASVRRRPFVSAFCARVRFCVLCAPLDVLDVSGARPRPSARARPAQAGLVTPDTSLPGRGKPRPG
jgi:hypothetical protein